MMNIFKKWHELVAPVSGELLNLTEVPDPVFAGKLAGDGIAIDARGDVIVAPAAGKLNFIFRTNHAFGMLLDNGAEILVHVGVDTVTLNGEGFERIANEGEILKAGDPVLRVQRDTLAGRGLSLITPVVIANADQLAELRTGERKTVQAGQDVIMSYRLK